MSKPWTPEHEAIFWEKCSETESYIQLAASLGLSRSCVAKKIARKIAPLRARYSEALRQLAIANAMSVSKGRVQVKTRGQCSPASGLMLWLDGKWVLVQFDNADLPMVWPLAELAIDQEVAHQHVAHETAFREMQKSLPRAREPQNDEEYGAWIEPHSHHQA